MNKMQLRLLLVSLCLLGSTAAQVGSPPYEAIDQRPIQPLQLGVHSIYPNPFNPQVTLEYALEKASTIKIRILDVSGKSVDTLVNGPRDIGNHVITWRPQNLATGIYFVCLQGVEITSIRKLIFLK